MREVFDKYTRVLGVPSKAIPAFFEYSFNNPDFKHINLHPLFGEVANYRGHLFLYNFLNSENDLDRVKAPLIDEQIVSFSRTIKNKWLTTEEQTRWAMSLLPQLYGYQSSFFFEEIFHKFFFPLKTKRVIEFSIEVTENIANNKDIRLLINSYESQEIKYTTNLDTAEQIALEIAEKIRGDYTVTVNGPKITCSNFIGSKDFYLEHSNNLKDTRIKYEYYKYLIQFGDYIEVNETTYSYNYVDVCGFIKEGEDYYVSLFFVGERTIEEEEDEYGNIIEESKEYFPEVFTLKILDLIKAAEVGLIEPPNEEPYFHYKVQGNFTESEITPPADDYFVTTDVWNSNVFHGLFLRGAILNSEESEYEINSQILLGYRFTPDQVINYTTLHAVVVPNFIEEYEICVPFFNEEVCETFEFIRYNCAQLENPFYSLRKDETISITQDNAEDYYIPPSDLKFYAYPNPNDNPCINHDAFEDDSLRKKPNTLYGFKAFLHNNWYWKDGSLHYNGSDTPEYESGLDPQPQHGSFLQPISYDGDKYLRYHNFIPDVFTRDEPIGFGYITTITDISIPNSLCYLLILPYEDRAKELLIKANKNPLDSGLSMLAVQETDNDEYKESHQKAEELYEEHQNLIQNIQNEDSEETIEAYKKEIIKKFKLFKEFHRQTLANNVAPPELIQIVPAGKNYVVMQGDEKYEYEIEQEEEL